MLGSTAGAGCWGDAGLSICLVIQDFAEARPAFACKRPVASTPAIMEKKNLSVQGLQDRLVNLFETTIRVLGGLQSAFAMSSGGDRLLLLKVLSPFRRRHD